jgi:hypothetical protein
MERHVIRLVLSVAISSFEDCAAPVAGEPPDYSRRLSQSDIAQLKQLVAQMPRLHSRRIVVQR